MESIVKLVIFLLGMVAFSLSVTTSIFFMRSKSVLNPQAKRLSNDLSLQLAAEAVIIGGTLLFSVGAWMGWLETWSIYIQSTIRLVMLFCGAITTMRLFYTLLKMSKDTDDNL